MITKRQLKQFKKWDESTSLDGMELHHMIVTEICKQRGISEKIADKIAQYQEDKLDLRDWQDRVYARFDTLNNINKVKKSSQMLVFRIIMYAIMWVALLCWGLMPVIHPVVWTIPMIVVLAILFVVNQLRSSRIAIFIYALAFMLIVWMPQLLHLF